MIRYWRPWGEKNGWRLVLATDLLHLMIDAIADIVTKCHNWKALQRNIRIIKIRVGLIPWWDVVRWAGPGRMVLYHVPALWTTWNIFIFFVIFTFAVLHFTAEGCSIKSVLNENHKFNYNSLYGTQIFFKLRFSWEPQIGSNLEQEPQLNRK